MRILITGATGFVGSHVVPALTREHEVRIATRRPGGGIAANEEFVVGDINESTEWGASLAGVDAVVHLAARVHVMSETTKDSLEAYREVNTRGTRRLAEASAEAGVQRFVFLSSIKVNGESTTGRPFTSHDAPAPKDPYGISKLEAELALTETAQRTGMAISLLRAPVVYGPGVGGNIRRIARLVQRGVPLPLGALSNRRTMLSVDNLLTWVRRGVEHDPTRPGAILMGDARPLSTAELARGIADGMGVRARLLRIPVSLLTVMGQLTGRGSDIDRLVQDLEVRPDIEAYPGTVLELQDPSEGLRALGASIVAERKSE